jgi:type VI secretion system protein ImpH
VPVRVVENVGRWTALRQRPGIGGSAGRRLQLGRGGVVGGRVFDVAGKFRVVLGPLDLTTYQALRPDGPKARLLRAAVALYLHDALDYDVELRLDPSELTPATLSDRRSRVGSTARLGRPPDTVVSEVVAYDGSRSLDA